MDKDKQDKYKIAASVKHIPKDAQVIMSILKELGITEYEPRVINQLLEFTYRYVTCILDDAKIYANHAKKKIIDLDDVKIASEMILDKTFTGPPPRDVLLEIARNKIVPLPPIKNLCGLRLPPDRYCLIAANYKIRPATLTKKILGKPLLEVGRSTLKTQFTGRSSNQSQNDKIKRSNTIVVTNKAQSVTAPKPVFKFNTSKPFGSIAPVSTPITNTPVPADVQMDVDEDGILLTTIKRKREDDEFVGA